MRILILKNGKVVPGQEERFKRFVEKEMEILKKIDAELRNEDPVYAAMSEPEDWMKEAYDSIVSAAFRFGAGDVSVEEDE